MGRLRRSGPFLAAVGSLLLAWKLAALALPAYLLPPPEAVLRALPTAAQDPEFIASVGRSLLRLGAGFALALGSGVTIGLLASILPIFRAYARALLSILQAVPPIAYLPLLILILGFGDRAILWVITLAALFPIAINAIAAVEQMRWVHIAAARNLGARPHHLALRVYLPASLPTLLAGAQAGFGNAWRALIAAEMFGGTNVGLGWSIATAAQVGDMARVLLGITTIGLLSAAIDNGLFTLAKRKLLRWRYA
ncbi:ABC transporter permease [Marinithermus hydrothermalis]|uniref:ABC-type transporter, integral membrane subunit n=1 Tax=Marinithermus hydrothermalis (strain DSM 14884 / JCM 11576 / T1) TaxID=869210 RepID=F2NMU8_MARHT|nr:ABC transporter permease subunit [Marinithermus hydrothermalis]AEB12482.1 ABC-type transporter, integral membrane subunit [Marinithermus hydrothermalis DSM 14884]